MIQTSIAGSSLARSFSVGAALLAAVQAAPKPATGIGGAKQLEWSDTPDERSFTFRRSEPDDPYLEKLRTQFELEDAVAGDDSDYERVRTVCEWVRGRWEHNGDNEPARSDPISILEEAATGKRFRCVEYAIVVAGALEALGIPARVLALKTEDVETRPSGAGHVVAEAWLAEKSKWILIDGQFDVIPTLAGEPLNAVELQRALARSEKKLGVDSLSGSKADGWFRWVAPYLYYLDTAFDRRFGVARSPGALMLVPLGAKNPAVFQGKYPISNMTYTSSVPAFYASPTAGAAAMPQAAPPNRSLDPGTAVFDRSIPAELDVHHAKEGLLLVRPRVNGKEAGSFILDTGAGICMVSTPHVERLGLIAAGGITAAGSGGTTPAQLYRALKVELGPLTLSDHPVMASDLSFLREHLGEEIAGIVGYGVFARSIVEIETAAPRVALHDPADAASGELARGHWLDIEVGQRVPVVTAIFEGHEGRFLLDTGANGSVSFYESTVRELRLLEGRSTVRDVKIGGVGGVVRGKEGELASFELGGVASEKVPATFLTQGRGSTATDARAGQIGIEMLGPFVLVLDYAGERMALRPRTPRGS